MLKIFDSHHSNFWAVLSIGLQWLEVVHLCEPVTNSGSSSLLLESCSSDIPGEWNVPLFVGFHGT